jgi:hypothetical protein
MLKEHGKEHFAVGMYAVYILPCANTQQSLCRVPGPLCRVHLAHGNARFSCSEPKPASKFSFLTEAIN